MARGSSSSKKVERESNREANPEVTERKRLKRLAFANSVLSETPAKVHEPLSPSKAVSKHHGKDVVKKSQRKNRFLFSFPGLLAPLGGGKIGELKDLGSKNPVLYLDFLQGRMKLFGTIVYPKNRYLTLQFPRGGKNVMCEDYFDNMIVFSEAWWIGRKDENPEEARLNFPKDLDEGQVVEYDFKGGAGAASVNKPGLQKTGMIYVDEQSPKAELEVDQSDGENNLKDSIKATPVRHSERTAGKTFNFAEASSGEDSVESDADVSEGEEKKVVGVDSSATKYTRGKTESLGYVALDIDNKDAVVRTLFPEKNEEPAMSVSKSKRLSHTATTVTTDKERSSSHNGSLVQTTISTLFKKVEEKKAPRNPRKSPSPKVSDQKLLHSNLKRKINEGRPSRKAKVIKETDGGGKIMAKKKEDEIEDEDIEEFSNSSKVASGSDEDWTA
ncbi:DNA-binding protein RHL1 isoform X2 [Alnus glutinosa]|uniref:DNA-binding protein RHL1 isoform X2 n=1 Tax=Alnus glutinosa TaxID=3517 RepID=UPI002D77AA17|nr:DNA-binding protein RHL1 isoform X2 [Alnus glutinosa]XP_062158329.1 DNA-binding protein RHL1 isoform X2 [Alnus glutinosa]XP_062158330.1 DNA-binding protein RHL1 isoform X2 [Alnus glutinosa]